MINVKIKFFGILKDYFDDLDLTINKNSTLESIKTHIINNYIDDTSKHLQQTIIKSIFSNTSEFLNDQTVLTTDCVIYLLPPFSGG